MDKLGFIFSMSEVMDKYFDLVMAEDFTIELQQSPEELKTKGYKYVVISGEYTYEFIYSDDTPKLMYWPENVVQFHRDLQENGILAVYWDHRPLKSELSSSTEYEIVQQDMAILKKLLTENLNTIEDIVNKWKSVYQIIFTSQGIKFHQRKINPTVEEKRKFEEELAIVMNLVYP